MHKYIFSDECSKWEIEGEISIASKEAVKVSGEASHLKDENDGILIQRSFTAKTDSDIICFEFDEIIKPALLEKNIYKYKGHAPFIGGTLNGLYVISFDAIHAMYSEEEGHASAQEAFFSKDENTYFNNGILFKNGNLYLIWSLVYKIIK